MAFVNGIGRKLYRIELVVLCKLNIYDILCLIRIWKYFLLLHFL